MSLISRANTVSKTESQPTNLTSRIDGGGYDMEMMEQSLCVNQLVIDGKITEEQAQQMMDGEEIPKPDRITQEDL